MKKLTKLITILSVFAIIGCTADATPSPEQPAVPKTVTETKPISEPPAVKKPANPNKKQPPVSDVRPDIEKPDRIDRKATPKKPTP